MDENDFDICFGCCLISAWISVRHTSISHELDPNANPAEGATAVWYSNLLEQSLWTSKSRAQANNICLAAYARLFIVQALLLLQVYGNAIYGFSYISNSSKGMH